LPSFETDETVPSIVCGRRVTVVAGVYGDPPFGKFSEET
jgi:hypothetical protein